MHSSYESITIYYPYYLSFMTLYSQVEYDLSLRFGNGTVDH